MRHKIYLFILFMCFSIFSSITAQDRAELENSKTKRVSDIFNYTKSTSNYLLLSQIDTNQARMDRNLNNPRNIVTIQQIGNQNIANTSSTSTNNMIDVLQIGNENVIESVNTLQNATERLIQNGNNNRLTNFSFGNVDGASLNVLQSGNNQIFEKFGTNSLTDKLSLRVIGNSQAVIIRSF